MFKDPSYHSSSDSLPLDVGLYYPRVRAKILILNFLKNKIRHSSFGGISLDFFNKQSNFLQSYYFGFQPLIFLLIDFRTFRSFYYLIPNTLLLKINQCQQDFFSWLSLLFYAASVWILWQQLKKLQLKQNVPRNLQKSALFMQPNYVFTSRVDAITKFNQTLV